jgi:hypothetical protein
VHLHLKKPFAWKNRSTLQIFWRTMSGILTLCLIFLEAGGGKTSPQPRRRLFPTPFGINAVYFERVAMN